MITDAMIRAATESLATDDEGDPESYIENDRDITLHMKRLPVDCDERSASSIVR